MPGGPTEARTSLMTRTMSDVEARALLSAGRVGRLGCVVKGEPYVLPINYVFIVGSIYSHSLPGRKIAALRAYARACLQVDEITDELRWRSVVAFGNFEEIDDNLQRARVLRKMLRRFPLLTPVESRVSGEAVPPRMIVFRLRIDCVTGVAEESDDGAYSRAMKEHQTCALAEPRGEEGK